jgi:predicted ATPase
VKALRSLGTVAIVPYWTALVAPALEASAAEALLSEQLRQIEATNERWCEAEVQRACGETYVRRGDQAKGEEYLKRAIEIARRQEARHWELRAITDLSRLWRDQGKRRDARDLLAPIYNWFTEGFDTPVLREARVTLEELAT